MKRNATITKTKAEPEEADVEMDDGKRYFNSPFGRLVIDKAGMTTREAPK